MNPKTSGLKAKGSITSDIQNDTLISKTISYIVRYLPAWRDDPNRRDEQAENQLNLQLVKYLDAQARRDFPMIRFDHEEYQDKRRSIPIAASPAEAVLIDARLHTIYDPILVIEGKRLPAPSRDRQMEYVSGGIKKVSGGIQRFKLGLHGGHHDIAAMIGYVQDHSLSHWREQINEWIAQFEQHKLGDICDWRSGEQIDLLEEDSRNGIACSKSVHNRIESSKSKKIELHHLWVKMNLNKQ